MIAGRLNDASFIYSPAILPELPSKPVMLNQISLSIVRIKAIAEITEAMYKD